MTLQVSPLGANKQVVTFGKNPQKKPVDNNQRDYFIPATVGGAAAGALGGATVLAPKAIANENKLTEAALEKLINKAGDNEELKTSLSTAKENIKKAQDVMDKNIKKAGTKITPEKSEKIQTVFESTRKEIYNTIEDKLPKAKWSGAAKYGAIGAALAGGAAYLYSKISGK